MKKSLYEEIVDFYGGPGDRIAGSFCDISAALGEVDFVPV